jgi:hypothetical protein
MRSTTLLLALSGCIQYAINPHDSNVDGVEAERVVEVFDVEPIPDKLDFIVVFDLSGSMEEELGYVTDENIALLEQISYRYSDWHVGFVPTDPGKVRLLGGEYLTSDMSTSELREMSEAVYWDAISTSAPLEHGLTATTEVFENREMWEGGFLREDSVKVVVIISDEDDQGPVQVVNYRAVMAANAPAWTIAIVDVDADDLLPDDEEKCPGAMFAKKYIGAADYTLSICEYRWYEAGTIIDPKLPLLHQWTLSQTPDADTIEVEYNGTLIPFDYDYTQNTVSASILVTKPTQVTVSYESRF